MFVLSNQSQLEKAAQKARKVRPAVKFNRFGSYKVSGSKGNFYTVVCEKDAAGQKVVNCECKGAEKGLVCYHAAAALSLHVGLARQRSAA